MLVNVLNIPIVNEIGFFCSLWIPERVLFVLRGSAVAMATESPPQAGGNPSVLQLRLIESESAVVVCIGPVCTFCLQEQPENP